MAAYPSAPDFNSSDPLGAWFTAGTIGTGGLRIYSMSAGTFVDAAMFRMGRWLGTRSIPTTDSAFGGSFSANEMIADGTWDLQFQSALIAIAELRGLGADTIAQLRAERAAQTVGTRGTTMAAWLIVDPELSAAGLASTLVSNLVGTRYPFWGNPNGLPSSITGEQITVTDPANLAPVLIVDAATFRSPDVNGGTGLAAPPAPAPSNGKWYAAAAIAAALLWFATQKKKRGRR